MTCKFSIGSRSQIENFRIVDWLDNFRNTELSYVWKYNPTQQWMERSFQASAAVFSALHLGGHGSSELLLFKSQWCRCHQRFQRDCIWSLCRLVKNLRIHGPMESRLSHQQLLTSIPSSFPTSSNGFFIKKHEYITKVAFFIEDDIWAQEHDICNLQSFIFCKLGKDLINQRYLSWEFQGFISW